MSDEVAKPIEEPIREVIIKESPVTDATIVVEESSVEPMITPEASPEPVAINEEAISQIEQSSTPIQVESNTETTISPDLDPTTASEVSESVSIPDLEPNQREAKPLSASTSTTPESVPTLETNHSSLEPNIRPYSLDPKLNKIIEGFVRGMNRSKENLVLARKATKDRMMKKVYKIMDLFKKKKKIKNDDVEKFLHTNDTDATRYLNILRKEGKVKREGKNNKTYYTKVE